MSDYDNITHARWCKVCNLIYTPDSRVYVDPSIQCPRCGAKLIKESEEEVTDELS